MPRTKGRRRPVRTLRARSLQCWSTERELRAAGEMPNDPRGCATASRSRQPWSSAALGAIATRRLRRSLFEISIGNTVRAVVHGSGQSRARYKVDRHDL
ncbi:MAG: hypothetical protein PVJ47_04425 [Thiohalocapsa sp.]